METFIIKKYVRPGNFLNACKKAIDKIYGFPVETEYEFWSAYDANKALTNWEYLNKNKTLSVNDGTLAIDFCYFTGRIYADQL